MSAFMLGTHLIRPTSPAEKTAHRLKAVLAALHAIHADLVNDQGRVRLSLCPGLVAFVQDDGIWWHSRRMLHPGIPLYVHRCTVDGAAEALACDYALLNPPGEEPPNAVAN
ncbi:hypothetical protein C1I98_10640 [Spongiactinospora gelatinilytica]|uniref:Uncharacterized protein n=1 Tax=Spongiactinospora gelatinilytica TaxID=2666298 RepID=A0A2W2GPE8_9ACTN|nr:hypothetical protein [Spongiactinospora gelatinilytica]PZG50391.1 hypothetical protein C1I98_10640 [Spongiactinospora gelatinilytica]